MNITVDKKKLLKALEEVKSLIKHYEKYYPYVYKHIVPNKLHAAVSALSKGIETCENFSTWYWDVSNLFSAIDDLNRSDTLGDSVKAAKAFGKLFIALSVLAAKVPNPIAKHYAQTLKVFGENFEKISASFLPAERNNSAYARVWANANDPRY